MTTVTRPPPPAPTRTTTATAPAPTTATSPRSAAIQSVATAPSAAAQKSISDALAQLQQTNGIIQNTKGEPVPLSYCFSNTQIADAQKRFGDAIKALGTQQPPLTDAQIKDGAAKLVDGFKGEFAFQKGMLDIFFRRSIQMMNQMMARIIQSFSGG